MFKKLNSSPTPSEFLDKCNISSETSSGQTQIEPDDLKPKIDNYEKVLLDDFKVSPEVFFNTIPININHIQAFINTNQNMAAARLYLAKESDNKELADYRMIFVPCSAVLDSNGEVEYYKDLLDGNILVFDCRTPPGCKRGALLL